MSEQNLTNPEPVGEPLATLGASQRQPIMQQVCESFDYMRLCTKTEFKRGSDKLNAAVLPFACVLLILAICTVSTPQLKALSFLAPMAAFIYYLSARIGIVRTMNTRQAYLTFHMLLATFLLGGTVALFLLVMFTLMMLTLHL
jgi:hypothetical protein